MTFDLDGAAIRLQEACLRYARLTSRSVPPERVAIQGEAQRRLYEAFCRPAPRTRLKPAAAEMLALRLGCKPMTRLLPRLSQWEKMRSRLQAEGFFTVCSAERFHENTRDGFTTRGAEQDDPRLVAYAGRAQDAIAEALHLDEALLSGAVPSGRWGPSTGRLGTLLGYPPCCIDAFVRDSATASNHELLQLAASRSKHFDPRLNVTLLSAFHLIAWTPCSFECAQSLQIAQRILDHLQAACPGDTSAALRMLSMPRMHWDDRCQLLFDGAIQPDGSVRFGAVHTPWGVDGRREDAAIEWVFFADVASRLSGGGVARVGGGTIEFEPEGGGAVREPLPNGALWLPFGS